MIYEKPLCPYCKSDDVVKSGKNRTGIKEKIMDMAMNGSGTRDTGRILKTSPNIDLVVSK